MKATSSTGDPNSFGFYTSRERWPSILQNVINDVQETTETCNLDAAKEGKQIIAALETIKNDIINDAKLEYPPRSSIAK
jgi:hypothetical protein